MCRIVAYTYEAAMQTYKNEHGRWVKGSHTLVLGRRDEYHDFSF